MKVTFPASHSKRGRSSWYATDLVLSAINNTLFRLSSSHTVIHLSCKILLRSLFRLGIVFHPEFAMEHQISMMFVCSTNASKLLTRFVLVRILKFKVKHVFLHFSVQFNSKINFLDMFLKQQTWDFVNRTVAALSVLAIGSQHSSHKNLFMEGHTPEHVLEVLLEWLRSLSLSDRTNRVIKVRFTGNHIGSCIAH